MCEPFQFGEIRLGDANCGVAWKSLETKCGNPDPERKLGQQTGEAQKYNSPRWVGSQTV